MRLSVNSGLMTVRQKGFISMQFQRFNLSHAAAFRTPCCSVTSDARAIVLKYKLLCVETAPNVGCC